MAPHGRVFLSSLLIVACLSDGFRGVLQPVLASSRNFRNGISTLVPAPATGLLKLDNGLGITPPMGYVSRSTVIYFCIVRRASIFYAVFFLVLIAFTFSPGCKGC